MIERRTTKRKKNPKDSRRGGRRYQPGKLESKRMDKRRPQQNGQHG